MNRDPDFDSSADMRLLELQRTSLGLAPPPRAAWDSRYAGESGPALIDEVAAADVRSAVLAVSLTANPSGSVIPGTVVTFALSIVNEGASAAKEAVVSVPLPGGVSYRLGSLVLDGRPAADDAAERLFGEGLALGAIDAKSRATLLWKVGVRMGNQALTVVPRVRAAGAAVIGASAVVVDRKGGVGAFADEIAAADRAIFEPRPLIPVEIPIDERPFYELDTEEEIVYEAADAALSDAVAHAEPEAAPEPGPEVEPEPESDPEPEPIVEVREAVIFYGAFERASLAFFDRVFNGSKEATILQHCIFASALTCTLDESGADAVGLKAHVSAQSQILHRVSLHEKLGKKEPIGEYAGTLTATIDAIVPRPVGTPPQARPDRLVLVNELEEPSLAVIRRIAEERERWDFVKARQLTLALQGQRVVLDDPGKRAAIDNALRIYAQTSMTVLQKLFVRLRVDRTTGVLFQNDAALDVAARNLLAVCAAALPPA